MGNVNTQLGQLNRDANKATAGFQAMGAKLTTIGTALTGAVTIPLAALGAVSVKSFADFDAAMNESLAIMGDVSESMRGEMSDSARQMAKESTFSAEQAAQSYYYLASAGLDAKASVEALPVVTRFAQAGMFDMATATDLLTDAQSALGLTIRDDAVANMNNMVQVSDVLVKANTLANASVQQFSEALTTKAGAAMRILGKDTEEGVAVLAAFADQGVKGSEAGTQFSIVLRDLQTKALSNAKEFKGLGIAVYDNQGEMNNLGDIIGDLEGALGGMSDEQKKATLLMLGFSDKSVAALQALVGTSGAIKKYEADLRSAAGTTDEVANKQLQSFSSQMKLLKSRVTDSAIEIGSALAPAISVLAKMAEPALKAMETLAKAFGNMPAPMQGIVIGAAAVAAALGPVALAVGLVSAKLPVLLTGLSMVKMALPSVLSGLGKIPALAVAAFAGWNLGKFLEQFSSDYKKAEAEVQKLSEAYAAQGIVVERGKMSLRQYLEALCAAKDAAIQQKQAEEALADEYDRMKQETEALIRKTEDHEEAQKKLAAAYAAFDVTDLRKDYADLRSAYDTLVESGEFQKLTTEQQSAALQKLNEVYWAAYGETVDYADALYNLNQITLGYIRMSNEAAMQADALTRAIADGSREMAMSNAAAYATGLSDQAQAAMEAAGKIAVLEDAYRELGIETSQSLRDKADAAKRAYESIESSGTASAQDILAAQRAAYEANERALGHSVSEQKSMWSGLSSQVSTIFTDMSRNIVDKLWSIPEHNRQLEKQEQELRDSLRERTSEWQQYQYDVVDDLREISEKHRKELEDQTDELKDQLKDQEKSYDRFMEDSEDRIEDIKQEHAEEYRDESDRLDRSLRDRTTDYERYKRDTLIQIERVRAAHGGQNSAEEDDLRQSLADRTEDYNTYCADIEAERKALAQKHKEDQAEEIKDVQESIKRKTEDHEAYTEDIKSKMEELVTANAEARAQEEADLKASLERQRDEYDAYKTDTDLKLEELKASHIGVFGAMKSALADVFSEGSKALARFATELASEQVLGAIKGFIDGPIKALGNAIAGAFGIGGDALATAADISAGAGSAAGSAASGGGGGGGGGDGIASWLNAGASIASAVMDYGMANDLGEQGRTLIRIENYLGSRADGGIVTATQKTAEALGYVNDSLDTLKLELPKDFRLVDIYDRVGELMDAVKVKADSLYDAITSKNTGGTVTINITPTAGQSSTAIANDVVSQLKLQMGYA
jgi:TP901 family phage tail tape measure protein